MLCAKTDRGLFFGHTPIFPCFVFPIHKYVLCSEPEEPHQAAYPGADPCGSPFRLTSILLHCPLLYWILTVAGMMRER